MPTKYEKRPVLPALSAVRSVLLARSRFVIPQFMARTCFYVFPDNGSNLRDQGVSVEDICKLLGHNDAEFTRRTYALPLENTHKKAIDFYEENLKRNLVNFL